MFLKNHLLLCLLIVALVFFSCKKYEDGGMHINAKKNLINKWTLKQFTANGADSLSRIDPRFLEPEALRVHDSHSSGAIFEAANPILQAGYPLVLFDAGLTLTDHKNKLRFSHTAPGIRNYPFAIANSEWEILEIQKSEVILQMHNYQNDKVYAMVWRSGD